MSPGPVLRHDAGYSYMMEDLIVRVFADARVQKIYAGTSIHLMYINHAL